MMKTRSQNTYVVVALAAVLSFTACVEKGKKDGEPKEVSTTSTELPKLVGVYKGLSGKISIFSDQTYKAEITQEINMRTGPGHAPTRDRYAICGVIEEGKLESSRWKASKFLKFQASKVEVTGAEPARRGDRNFDPKELCQLYAEARQKNELKQSYEILVPGAISLREWPTLYSGTFANEPTHFSQLLDFPKEVGFLFTEADKTIDLTVPLMPMLKRATQVSKEIPSEDYKIDGNSRMTVVSNSCAFAYEFQPSIFAKNGVLTVYSSNVLRKDTIDTAESRTFKRDEQWQIHRCQDYKEGLEKAFLDNGLALDLTSWQSFDLIAKNWRVSKSLYEIRK